MGRRVRPHIQNRAESSGLPLCQIRTRFISLISPYMLPQTDSPNPLDLISLFPYSFYRQRCAVMTLDATIVDSRVAHAPHRENTLPVTHRTSERGAALPYFALSSIKCLIKRKSQLPVDSRYDYKHCDYQEIPTCMPRNCEA